MNINSVPPIQLCIALTKSGLTAYGAPEALRQLGRQLLVTADAPPDEHYEVHASMTITAPDGVTPAVCVLVDAEIAPLLDRSKRTDVDGELLTHAEFELTFMAVTNSELHEMGRYSERGVLPETWNDEQTG
jgi:hypothetical protein